MKIKFPEPIDPVVLYEFSAKNKEYRTDELKELLNEFKKSLDSILSNLGKEFKLFDYSIVFFDAERERVIEHLEGGFDLEIKKEWSIKDLRERYSRSFERILQEYRERQFLIDIDVSIVGFRDKATREAL